MIGEVTRRMLPYLPGVPHLHVNRPSKAPACLSWTSKFLLTPCGFIRTFMELLYQEYCAYSDGRQHFNVSKRSIYVFYTRTAIFRKMAGIFAVASYRKYSFE